MVLQFYLLLQCSSLKIGTRCGVGDLQTGNEDQTLKLWLSGNPGALCLCVGCEMHPQGQLCFEASQLYDDCPQCCLSPLKECLFRAHEMAQWVRSFLLILKMWIQSLEPKQWKERTDPCWHTHVMNKYMKNKSTYSEWAVWDCNLLNKEWRGKRNFLLFLL